MGQERSRKAGGRKRGISPRRLRVVSLTLEEAERFLRKRWQIYQTPRAPCLIIAIADEDGLHGALIAARNSATEAALVHVYSDGIPGGFSLLYGSCWRALKAMGFAKAIL